jgi:CMP/dCMP kinase
MTAIAIDGPAGAGKSTVARRVADALGWEYFDTGAMYRAITLAALRRGIEPTDDTGLAELTRALQLEPRGSAIYLDGVDVAAEIRSPAVNEAVPVVAAQPSLRSELVALQRALSMRGNVVMEGRDIGTKVLPDAEIKVWLTADLDERARRRADEMGEDDLTRLRVAIESRDAADESRDSSPLRKADGALEIDSTGLTIDEVVQRIVDEARSLEGS